MSIPGNTFLHERNPNFHASPEVEHVAAYLRANGEAVPDDRRVGSKQEAEAARAAKIGAYIQFLADQEFANDGLFTGDETSIDRQMNHLVIKAEDIPDGYFDLQRRIAREQGHGDIEISEEMRREAAQIIRKDQSGSLRTWIDYLTGDGAEVYEDWFKQYVYDGVLKLADYDKRKGEFRKRSNETVAKYPDLNREALSLVYDKLKAVKLDGGHEPDETWQKLAHKANFNKLYSHALHEATSGIASPEEFAITEGSWRVFPQSTYPEDIKALTSSLVGRGTGWCTSGDGYASSQLAAGDFMVYFSKDRNGEEKIPRIAIRMQHGEIAEVRGIVGGGDGLGAAENTNQELEGSMVDIAADKLRELPGGASYSKKVEDMKRLTRLEKILTDDPNSQLTDEDLRFLYEIDAKIEGFGYESDPRVKQARALRGEQDYPVLGSLLRESLKDQVHVSYTAYTNIIDQLNSNRSRWNRNRIAQPNPIEFMKILERKQAEWEESGVFDYLVERLVQDGARVQLVATPNILAGSREIKDLAREFGMKQPYETYIYEQMYDAYSAEELSGSTQNGDPVRFMLMPTEYDESLTGTQEQQLSHMQALQVKLPQLKVPSVLDAITYWHTLRAGGDKLDSPGAYSRTVMRHFNLPAKSLDGWRDVPDSFVGNGGGPVLDFSDVDGESNGRLAVG